MKAPKSLTNRRDRLIARIQPLQAELDAINRAIAVLEYGDEAPQIAQQNQAASASEMEAPPAFIRRNMPPKVSA